jgi:PAS domain S-box-containing protein
MRLLERAGRAAWLIDAAGTVAWANGMARHDHPALAAGGASLCDAVPGFAPGGTAPLGAGTLVCEGVEGGWAVFLEPRQDTALSARVLDMIPVPIFWKDSAGFYRGCNQAFAEMLGRPADEIVGRSVFELSPPEMAAKYQSMDNELLAGGMGAIQRYEWDVRAKDGHLRHVLFHKACVDDGAGVVQGLVGVVLDITELRRLERKFATVFNVCPDTITITEAATGRYLDVNDAYFTTTGYSREEALGRTSMELGIWVDVEERNALLSAFREHGRLVNFETRFRRKDGSVFTALVSVEGTELDGTQCLILVARDISARKQAEVVLRRTADELHRSNLELERFAYVAAHDLQEPCRTICSFAQLLERRCGEALGEEGREYLSYLSAGAQRMRELIQGLLRYSRVDSNTLRFEQVSLAGLMTSALGDLSGAIDQTGAVICVGDLPDLRGDAMQLHQVLINLVGNALKFQPPGQRPRIEVDAQRAGEFWQISVRDNGIGIAPEYVDEIFGMFRRLHGGAAYPGTGIGLALVKRIVEAHGGSIWVESTPGHGSTFRLTLPA